jgi:hypothetical protein
MSRVGTLAYYKEVESKNTRLRSKLLARTKKINYETAGQWLNRVAAKYERMKIKPR